MLFTFLGIMIINLTILGYAGLFKKVLYPKSTYKIENIEFINGYFFLIAFSIFINFLTPLKNLSFLVLILGLVLFIFFFSKKFYKLNLISLTIISTFFAFITINHKITYDSQLYHLQTIQLNLNNLTIFGIANLEPRYGMNSSWHSFLSLINVEIKFIKLIYLANISLFCFFFNEIFKINFLKSKKLSDLFILISIFYISVYSFFHPSSNGTILINLSSPEVDTVAMTFFILSLYLFLKFAEEKDAKILSLLLLSIFLTITIKIGYIGVILFLLYLFIRKDIFLFSRVNLILLFSGIAWLSKSFFLSGCLIFPIASSCIKTSWAMSKFDVEGYRKIVQSFARDTPERLKFTDFNHTLNSFDWFNPWFHEYFLKTEFLFISIIIISLNIIVILSIYFFYKKRLLIKKNFFFFVLFVLIVNFYIWFKAPEIRFGYGTIISTVAFTTSILILFFFKKFLNKPFLYIIILLIFLPLFIKNEKNINHINSNVFSRNFDYSSLDNIYNSNKFKVYSPTKDVFCNFFQGFCSYQGFKVKIEQKGNYIFVFKD